MTLLRENKIVYEYVPNNMTSNFQVLDLTVNKWVKGIMMNKFNKWFAETLRKELDAGKSLDEISIKFKLKTMKPFHAKWVIDVFNELSHLKGWMESFRNIGCLRKRFDWVFWQFR